MTTEIGHGSFHRRIAINVGAGYVPGINAVIAGAAMAAGKMGWEMVGIRDGFEGLLHPERYPDGGLVTLSPQLIENLVMTKRQEIKRMAEVVARRAAIEKQWAP